MRGAVPHRRRRARRRDRAADDPARPPRRAPIAGQWILTAYRLAFGGVLLLGGRLGDLYGRRRMLVAGMVLFAGGSMVAAAAPVLAVLVAARAVQGLGSALAVPAGLAILPLDLVAAVVSLAAAGALARRPPRRLLVVSFALSAAALFWLARAPVPASYALDLGAPLVVLGVSLPIAFVVATNEAVADVGADEKGVASGIFETANHLFGGAVGVAIYATLISAASYRAAFLGATALVALGIVAAAQASPRAARSAG